MKIPKLVIYFTVAILLIALAPMPYGYYTLLKVIVCGVFTWAALITYSKKPSYLPWVFALLAAMFNPIIPIILSKELWVPIDIGAALFLYLNKKEL